MTPPLHPARQIELWTREARARHAAEIAALVPVVRELASHAGATGVTVADLRQAAVARNLLPEKPDGRQLSFLGCVMKRAGLVTTGQVRRSTIDRSHGNRHSVWVLPSCRHSEAA